MLGEGEVVSSVKLWRYGSVVELVNSQLPAKGFYSRKNRKRVKYNYIIQCMTDCGRVTHTHTHIPRFCFLFLYNRPIRSTISFYFLFLFVFLGNGGVYGLSPKRLILAFRLFRHFPDHVIMHMVSNLL